MPAGSKNQITVLYSPAPNEVRAFKLSLSELKDKLKRDVTVADVIHASGLMTCYAQLDLNALSAEGLVGIWSKSVALETTVQEGDRVEVYRALRIDPKEARRLRYESQGPVQSRHRPGYKGP